MPVKAILHLYGFDEQDCGLIPFGSGLINHTWRMLHNSGQEYILQKINTDIFKNPQAIDANIRLAGHWLAAHAPAYLFVQPVATVAGDTLVEWDGGHYRIFPFVKGSHTVDVVQTPQQAYEAAQQFGRFTQKLSGLPVEQLQETLPGFHDLAYRYRQFETALQQGNRLRITEAKELILFLQERKSVADQYEAIKKDTGFTIRATHHDTKISNVLLDENDRGLCVIDLDTLMPGYFISDLGDMLRTCVCPVSEEEQDFSKIVVREDFLRAIVSGYLSGMGDVLSETEKRHFMYAGKFMVYMQALRFLTDHLNNDRYYGAKYEGHNLVRAGNQAALLRRIEALPQDCWGM
jgi:Ser/Thr protein kinase RdoA (MazF antagonist)